jgi:AcrR family transcriptional regulator
MVQAAANNRYERKRELILAAAQGVLAKHGVRGMTLAQVAAQVGINPQGVTYYFRKKEDLAAACFLAGIARLDAIMVEAAQAPDEQTRLRRVFEGYFARHRRFRLGEESPIASLGEMRTLDEPHATATRQAFAAMFRKARALFEGPRFERHSRKSKTALTHLLLEQIFWTTNWLPRYDVEDYQHVLERTCDIYFGGLAAAGEVWRPHVSTPRFETRAAGADLSREDFFIAATRLINRLGYRGASVDKISAELRVTKGSFYHHHEAKEDLAAACFERSLALVRSVQLQALAGGGSAWDKLNLVLSALIDYQLSEQGPLLRASVLSSLPDPPRSRLSDSMGFVVGRFAGMIADCAAVGSARPVDQQIAAQMLRVTINAAAEARSWVRGLERAEASELYAKPLLMGVFA